MNYLRHKYRLYRHKKIITLKRFANKEKLLPLQPKTNVEGFELIATTIKKC